MNNFNAIKYHESENKFLGSVDVSFESESLQFQDQNISFQSLKIRLSGANNSLVYFYYTDSDSPLFYIRRSKELIKLLKECKFSNREEFNKSLLTYSNHLGMQLSLAVVILAFIAGTLFLLKDPLINGLSKTIPYKYEKMLGEALFEYTQKDDLLISDKEVLDELHYILTPLIENLPKNYREPKIYISKSSKLNAFTMPGGIIVFNEGLLKRSSTIEEVQGVAAHEFAHMSERHVIKNIFSAVGAFAVFDVLIGDMSGFIAAVLDQGSFLLRQSFSRDFEREADRIALEYLEKSQISPQGLIDMFTKMKEEHSLTLKEGEKALSFLNTHPDTDERIEMIKKTSSAYWESRSDYPYDKFIKMLEKVN